MIKIFPLIIPFQMNRKRYFLFSELLSLFIIIVTSQNFIYLISLEEINFFYKVLSLKVAENAMRKLDNFISLFCWLNKLSMFSFELEY